MTSDVKRGPAGKSLEVEAGHEAVRNFEPIIESGVHFLSIWFLFENIGGGNTLHIYFGDTTREWNAGPVIRIGSQSGDDNQVGVHDGGTVQPVALIKQGQWQHIRSVMDVDKHTYSVYVDDKLAAEDFAWRNPAGHPGLGWLMLGFDGGAGLIGYYDDIIFAEGDTPPAAVEPEAKLATAWGSMKI